MATTTAVSTTSAPSAVPTPCGASTYDIPTKDAACAIPGTNHKDSMDKCCKSPVVTYDNGCGMYCLASGQAVGELVKCLTGNGVKDGQVFCNKELNATATAKPTSTNSNSGGSNSATGTGSANAAKSSGAAVASLPYQPISKPAVGVLFTLLFSTFASIIAA
ncbi:hypothetical protein PRK78_001751 [Emydomyces testavorans]|uniref:Uncharacterized protein n=1 Tax=Emydomyces testavorans TaxID=2070801 RepID=A0AAF0IGZ7_9EURO|nr:hypothetical protein PRK78_001751 [Emydomyces testavorans]